MQNNMVSWSFCRIFFITGLLVAGCHFDSSSLNDIEEINETDSNELKICGNGLKETEEICDDGNTAEGDGCSSVCEIEEGWECLESECLAICGDGIEVGNELLENGCDDGNREIEVCETTEPCVVCGVDCAEVPGIPRVSTCGNGIVEGAEGCDEAYENTNDCPYSIIETSCEVCSTSCVVENGNTHFCGDSVVDPVEICDENSLACIYGERTCERCNDTCSEMITMEGVYCGDGIVQPEHEACDGSSYCDDFCNEICPYSVDWIYSTSSILSLWIGEFTDINARSRENGQMTIRYTATSSGEILPGPVALISLEDPWLLSLESSGIRLHYDLLNQTSNEDCSLASGELLSSGQIEWDTCNANQHIEWTPVEGASGSGCIANYQRVGSIICEELNGLAHCYSQTGILEEGENWQNAVWNQPLNGLQFSSDFRSFAMLDVPFGPPDDIFSSREWGTETPDEYSGSRSFFQINGSNGSPISGSLRESCSFECL